MSPSTRSRDERLKRDLFNRVGVREYWLVNPDTNVITVYRRDDGGQFGEARSLTAAEHEVLTTPLLPGLSVALDACSREDLHRDHQLTTSPDHRTRLALILSPSALTAATVTKMHAPGKSASHGSVLIVVCAW